MGPFAECVLLGHNDGHTTQASSSPRSKPMQLDRTRIAIRERSILDIFDLSLQVVRVFFWPIATAWLLAVVPLMILNWFLVGWMVQQSNVTFEFDECFRYSAHYVLLVFAESPLLSIPIVAFLGPAVFMERPTLWQTIKSSLQFALHLIFCLLILRLIGPIIAYCGTRGEFLEPTSIAFEWFIMLILYCYTAGFHILRPFTTEIILLEKPPFWSKDGKTLSLWRRSGFLHGPASNNLIGHWIVASILAILLALSLLLAAYLLVGVLVNEWGAAPGNLPGTLHWWWIFPVPLFMVSGFLAVVRFLCYLDVRIRNEGWEVGLLLDAEAARVQNRITV